MLFYVESKKSRDIIWILRIIELLMNMEDLIGFLFDTNYQLYVIGTEKYCVQLFFFPRGWESLIERVVAHPLSISLFA